MIRYGKPIVTSATGVPPAYPTSVTGVGPAYTTAIPSQGTGGKATQQPFSAEYAEALEILERYLGHVVAHDALALLDEDFGGTRAAIAMIVGLNRGFSGDPEYSTAGSVFALDPSAFVIPDYILGAVLWYLCFGVQPGSLVRAILCNNAYDIMLCSGALDDRQLRNMVVMVNQWLPTASRGSAEKVKAWMARRRAKDTERVRFERGERPRIEADD